NFPTPTPPTTTIPTTIPPFTTTTTIPIPPITTIPTPTPLTTTPTIPTPPTTTTQPNTTYHTPTLISTILNTLGYKDLSTASLQANLTTTTIPTTIFAPSDTSLLTCPTCSLPLLLQEHSLPGLYPLHYLQSLFFGTKIETLSPNKCLTITSTTTPSPPKKIFINGIEITKPELFNDGFLIIHGLQGFVSHLSPFSCNIEKMTSLAFPPQHASTLVPSHVPRLMLNDAMIKLRISGYSIVALALREKYSELSELNGLTIFALDDNAIFAGKIGHKYVADIGYHIVPNEVLGGKDLVGLKAFTVLPTTKRGESLVVTTASGGGPMVPMRINYVKIKNFDLVHDDRVVVHGLSMPFPHVEDQRKSEL
ncbi:hypothetical protein Leryth_004712, partial [Lithospermum erythrorhizon]